eukprot:COSAG01_NODE_291_length_19378_cov_38.136418_20_plen_51_part_00
MLIEADIVVPMTHFRHKVSWGPELLRGRDMHTPNTYIAYNIHHIHVCRRW